MPMALYIVLEWEFAPLDVDVASECAMVESCIHLPYSKPSS